MPAKRVRWECPAGEHPGVLGSTRPPKDAVVRFCLPCSEASGRLVERQAPALERQRAARRDAGAAKRARAAAKERERAAAAFRVDVLDYGDDGARVELDVRELLRRAWASKEVRDITGTWSWKPQPLPGLTVRRGKTTRLGRGERPERARDGLSGHAYYGGGDITLTIAPHCGREWVEAIVLHEAIHSASGHGVHHGDGWRAGYLRLARELYAIEGVVLGSQQNWKLDEEIAAAIRTKGTR